MYKIRSLQKSLLTSSNASILHILVFIWFPLQLLTIWVIVPVYHLINVYFILEIEWVIYKTTTKHFTCNEVQNKLLKKVEVYIHYEVEKQPRKAFLSRQLLKIIYFWQCNFHSVCNLIQSKKISISLQWSN